MEINGKSNSIGPMRFGLVICSTEHSVTEEQRNAGLDISTQNFLNKPQILVDTDSIPAYNGAVEIRKTNDTAVVPKDS